MLLNFIVIQTQSEAFKHVLININWIFSGHPASNLETHFENILKFQSRK